MDSKKFNFINLKDVNIDPNVNASRPVKVVDGMAMIVPTAVNRRIVEHFLATNSSSQEN